MPILRGLLHWLLSALVFMTGCGGPASVEEIQEQPDILSIQVSQIDQVHRLGRKIADGQYLVVNASIKNLANETRVLAPADFRLRNITDNAEERYSQPAERMMSANFASTYGRDKKDKLMDFATTNLYPRLHIERYFVFMVPNDADLRQYELAYTLPASSGGIMGNTSASGIVITAPLVTSETIVNDRRESREESQPY